MIVDEIMEQLKNMGSEQTRKTYFRHGAKEPLYGVKIADLKKILKKHKNDYETAVQLYDTGNSDAMYLAGLMIEPAKMSKELLNQWVKKAYWYMLSEVTVADVAAETKFGWELGLEWIQADEEMIAAAGWATLSSYISIQENDQLDLAKVSELLDQIKNGIEKAQNRVRYTMNNFVICVGSYIPQLTKQAQAIAKEMGKISVNMGNTSCKVPYAPDYIQKVIDKGYLGKKRQKTRC
ncbi:MAG: DNA alkylation repair protein [Spirochaetes bacterium]|nr:DNA alkylation repair protein [Spirochaetota bacterium]